MHKESIRIIARELGLERTPEQYRTIRSRRRKELVQKERRRIIFGLDQKTNIKVVSNLRKIRLRGSLKRLGYIIGADGHTFYYDSTLRRHPVRASPAVSANEQIEN